MWQKTYSKRVKNLTVEQVWRVWADINQWHTWQDDIEYAKLDGEFKTGNTFLFKPKGCKEVRLQLLQVVPNKNLSPIIYMSNKAIYTETDVIRLNIQVKPQAQQNKLAGIINGKLKVLITAPPVDGKANDALIKFIAKTLQLKNSDVRMIHGENNSSKVLELPLCAKDILDALIAAPYV